MSRDVISAVSLLALIVSLMILTGSLIEPMAGFMGYCLQLAAGADFADVAKTLGYRFLNVAASTLAPVLVLMVSAGVIATLVQTKLLVTTEPIKPKFSKISPGKKSDRDCKKPAKGYPSFNFGVLQSQRHGAGCAFFLEC